jgi:predicted dehydrogenase
MRIDHRGELFITKAGDEEWTEIGVELGLEVAGITDTGFSRGFMAFAPRIVQAIRNGNTTIEHAATFADGVEVQRVLDAARESDSIGGRVTVSR